MITRLYLISALLAASAIADDLISITQIYAASGSPLFQIGSSL